MNDPLAIIALALIGVLSTLLIVDSVVEIPYVHRLRLVLSAGIGAAVATLTLVLTRNGSASRSVDDSGNLDSTTNPTPPGGTTKGDHADSLDQIEHDRSTDNAVADDDRSDGDFWRDA